MKKKILHILSSSGFAGAENVAMSIISNLSDEYDFAYTSPKGSIKKVLCNRGIKYLAIEDFSIKEIRKVIKDWKPDVIHAHDFNATIKTLIASYTIPLIAHIHQNPAWLKKVNLFSTLFFISCLKINKIIVVSPAVKESSFLSNTFKDKTQVINNIVDVKWIKEMAQQTSEKKYDIAFIGRFEDVKDPLKFIEIVSHVRMEIPQIKVIMMGGGGLMAKCQEAIANQNLNGNIDITDFVENPFPVLKNIKILVMTSKSEGLPMVAIEALSMGKPVIVPKLDGIENIVDSSCGYICKSDSEFVEAIITLLKSNELYTEMSLHAYEKAVNMFDMEEYKEKFIKVYDNVK